MPQRDDETRKELHIMNRNLRKLIRQNMLWQTFVRGIVFGLATTVGATVILALLIYLLGQFTFIPVIGDWLLELRNYLTAPSQ